MEREKLQFIDAPRAGPGPEAPPDSKGEIPNGDQQETQQTGAGVRHVCRGICADERHDDIDQDRGGV